MTSRWLGVVPLLLLAAPLAGQSVPERQALQRWRDSLTAVTDTTVLRAWEERAIAVAAQSREDPMQHLRLGFLALRLRELGSRKHLDHAVSEFEWALELRPDWPFPSYGLGLASQYHSSRTGFAGGLFTILGIDGTSRSLRAFEDALAADSQFSEAAAAMADVALDSRNELPLDSLVVTMRRVTRDTQDPDLLLLRGRVERLAAHPDSALTSFLRAIDHGAHPGVLLFELARTIPLVPSSIRDWLGLQPFDTLYFQGARSDDSVVVSLYRADLAPIAADSLLAEFDRQTGVARSDWLRSFWGARDAQDLRASGERLAEHLRRWDQARREFTLSGVRRRYAAGLEIYRSGHAELDDRGIALVRHGTPSRRIVWPRFPRGPEDTVPRQAMRDLLDSAITLPPEARTMPAVPHNYGNETWIYRHPDGNLVLHFAANFDARDYRMQSSVLGLDVSFREILRTVFGGAEMPEVRMLLESDDVTVSNFLLEERLQARRDIQAATTTDRWTREYATTLPGRVEWFRAGARDGRGLGHLVYTMDARSLRAQPWSQVPVTVRAVLLDAAGMPLTTIDTTVLVDQPKPTASYVSIRVDVPLPPTVKQSRVAVEITPEIGQLHATTPLQPLPAGALMMADLLVGRRAVSIPWPQATGDTVWLDPQLSYRPSDTLEVWTELDGLRPDVPYTVRVVLTRAASGIGRVLGRRQAVVTIASPITFAQAHGILRREIPLGTIEPGDYQLEVVLEGPGGRVAQQRRVYVVP